MKMVDLDSLVVRSVRPKQQERWDELMSSHHYLGFEKLVGQAIKYVAVLDGKWVALLGWATSALKCGPRDEWIGWTRQQQYRRVRYVVNNQRLLILTGVMIKNLASKTLAVNTDRLSDDWEAVFGGAGGNLCGPQPLCRYQLPCGGLEGAGSDPGLWIQRR